MLESRHSGAKRTSSGRMAEKEKMSSQNPEFPTDTHPAKERKAPRTLGEKKISTEDLTSRKKAPDGIISWELTKLPRKNR